MPANAGAIVKTSAPVAGDFTFDAGMRAWTIRGADATTTVDFGTGTAVLVGIEWWEVQSSGGLAGKTIAFGVAAGHVVEFLTMRSG